MNMPEMNCIDEISRSGFVNRYLPCGILIAKADFDLTILEANQGFFDYVGYTREEVQEQFQNKGFEMFHSEDVGRSAEYLIELLQMEQDVPFEFEVRIFSKDAGYKYTRVHGHIVHNSEEETLISCMLTDLSEHMRVLKQAEEERDFNALIVGLTDDSFFDCDLLVQTIRYSKNFADRFGLPEVLTNYPESFVERGIVAPESLHFYENRFMLSTNEVQEEELHLILPDQTSVWYSCRYHVTCDQFGIPVRAVGNMIDTTKHHTAIGELQEKASKDPLTGLYNKAATESLIEETLRYAAHAGGNHALFVIDIDNFKEINDKLGHLYGDMLLSHQAEKMRALFRADDIVGRIGGDEFFVFLKYPPSGDVLVKKAQQICRCFKRTYMENGVAVSTSASVGVALYPQHGKDYTSLYKKADMALYVAKDRGKDGYVFFNGESSHGYQSKRTEIDSAINTASDMQMSRFFLVFRMLHVLEDTEKAMNAMLKMLAEQYQFGRAYIYEFSSDEKMMSSTFSWRAPECDPIMSQTQEVPIHQFEKTVEQVRESGVFLAHNLSEIVDDSIRAWTAAQGIKSCILLALRDNGALKGLIGFDDCVNERIFPNSEIKELAGICNIVETFLFKYRAQQQHDRDKGALFTILDHVKDAILLVDMHTHRVLYENRYMKELFQHEACGSVCYEAFRQKTEPCEECVIPRILNGEASAQSELYYEKLGAWMHISGAAIELENQARACLMSCTRIAGDAEGKPDE